MPFVQWEARYSVGIAAMDAQHQKLMGMLNVLHEAMTTGTAQDELGQVLEDLETYTRTHFAAEEGLMRARRYSGLAAHQVLHAEFAGQVRALRQQGNASVASGSIGLSRLLRDWLTQHILSADHKYGAALGEL
jgi:hemerythrin-like metal-binding protein